MESRKREMRFARRLALPMRLWMVAFVFVSLLYVVGLSFCTRGESMSAGLPLTMENYRKLLDPTYLRVLLNSLVLALLTTALCVLVGYPFAYWMAGLKPRMRALLMLLLIIPFWTNELIRIYGWRIFLIADGPLNGALQALGLSQGPLKLLYTDGAVLLGMVYTLLPFMILPSYSAVEKLDRSVVDAARDLGASPIHAFLTVTVPLTAGGLLAGCVLVFIPSMGLFFLNDLLGGSKNVLVGGLIQRIITSRNLPLAAALSVLMLAVTGAVLLVYRRFGGDGSEAVGGA